MNFCLSILPKNREEKIIFSLPKSNHYHQIKNIKIAPDPNLQILDEWGNEIIIFNDVLKIDIRFKAQLKEIKIEKEVIKKFSLKDYQKLPKNQLIFYTQPNRFINGQDKQIKQIAKKIAGQETNLYQIIEKIYSYTLNHLVYANPIEGLYSYHQVLKEKKTDCGGFSTFFISLCHSINIPSRLVVGFLVKENLLKKFFNMFYVPRGPLCGSTFQALTIHAWPEILLPDDSWFPLDPSIEWRRQKGLTKREGGMGYIPADRLVVSYGCDFKIKMGKINYQLDILQKPISVESMKSLTFNV